MDNILIEKIKIIESWLIEKKAFDIISVDVSEKCSFTEYLIVCTGMATLHNRAIADYIVEKAHEHNIRILGKEGFTASTWILLDLNDVIVHIFTSETRTMYQLEDLWTNRIKKQDIDNEN